MCNLGGEELECLAINLSRALARRLDTRESGRLAIMVAGFTGSFLKKLDGRFKPRLQLHADIAVDMMVVCLISVENKIGPAGPSEQSLNKESKRWIRLKCEKHFSQCIKKGVACEAEKLVLSEFWREEIQEHSMRSFPCDRT